MNAQLKPVLPESELSRKAHEYLRTKRGSLPAIALETGVGYQWLMKFANGHIADPGVLRVEAILRHAKLLPSLANTSTGGAAS